MSDLKNILKKV